MPLAQEIKKVAEKVTGIGRPSADDLAALVNRRTPRLYRFEDDGKTPNNPRLPLVLYRNVLRGRPGLDPAAVCEELFAAHGWTGSWRDGIYDFLHFHTRTHEVLGVARGEARVQFGGDRGRTLSLKAGDVVVLPAGTGHRRISASDDLLVVGAYPASSGGYDEPRAGQVDHRRALECIGEVPAPAQDPVYGRDGPLKDLWGTQDRVRTRTVHD
jgi:uncharacterized protein YjlB